MPVLELELRRSRDAREYTILTRGVFTTRGIFGLTIRTRARVTTGDTRPIRVGVADDVLLYYRQTYTDDVRMIPRRLSLDVMSYA